MSIEKMLDHRTIREFTKDQVPKEVISTLKSVVNRAPTWMGMQAYSIISVKDENIRREILDISKQEYLMRCPELWIFVADLHRNMEIMKEKSGEAKGLDMDRFIHGFSDAMIAAQQLIIAAEELGLGCVYFGSVVNDYGKLAKILKLPKGTFPVVGVGFGYPNQKPQIKPRMSMDLKFFEDTYKVEENYMAKIKDYDDEMTTYYDTRDEGRRSDCFSDQIVGKYGKRVFERDQILKAIRDQGFDLKI